MSALLLGLLFALQSLLMPVRAEAPVLLSLEDIEFSTSQRRAALQAQTRLPSSRLRHLAASSDPDLLAPGADNLPLLALQDSQPLSGARLGRHVAEQLRQAGDRLLNPLSDPQQLAGLLEQSRAGGAELSGRLNHLGEQALQSMVDSGLNQVEQRLQGRVVRRVELGYRSSFGGREELFQADLQLSLWEQERRAALFGQLGALTRDGEGGANVGVGYRHLVSGGLLLGLNAFYDYLSDPSVQRWSVGGELKGSLLDLSGNWYQGQGDERTGNVEQYSPDGWDLELAGRLPRFPWVEAGARYYHWDGEGADEDLEGVRYRVLLKPFSLFGLGVEYDDPERGSEDWGVEAEFSYQFGQSMNKQLDPLQFTRTDPWGRRYERVKREYEIRVRSRTIAVTVAELDADELTVDPGTGTATPGRQSASEDVPSPVVVNVPLRLPGAVAGSGAVTLQQTVRVLLEGTATPGRAGAPVPEADYLLSATAADASGAAASVSIEPSTGTPQSVDVEFGPSQQVLMLVLTLDLQSDGEAEGEESVELRVQGAAEALAVLGITDSVGSGASISTSTPSPLTEGTLNGATLTVTLTGTEYAEASTLSRGQFTLNTTVPGVTVSLISVSVGDTTNAVLTLTYDGSDFDTTAMLGVTVAAAAHTGTGDLTTDTVPVTAVVESNNAQLSALVLSESTTLVPTFVSATTTYTATVANSVSSLTVTPTAADAGASITVNTTAVGSGVASGPITLDEGLNSIAVVVTAADGSMLTYTVAVTRMTALGAAISATNPAALTEENLNTAILTVTLTNNGVCGRRLAEPRAIHAEHHRAGRNGESNQRQRRGHDQCRGADFDTNATLGVTVAAAAPTGTVPMTAVI